MKKTLFFIILLIPFCIQTWADDSVVICQKSEKSNPYQLSIEFTLPPFEVKKNGEYHLISIPEWANVTEPGLPQVPVRGILLELPESGNIELRVLETEWEAFKDSEHPEILIPPVPRLTLSDNGKIITEFVKNNTTFTEPAFFPKVLAEIDSKGMIRGTPVCRIIIYPFQWHPITKELRYCKKMHLEVFVEPYSTSVSAEKRKQSVKTKRETDDNPKLKIEILEDRIYRLTSADLANAGIDTSTIDPSSFQLFNFGKEVAISILNQEDDYSVEFFAQAIDNQFTGTNVYWLGWGDSQGKRITFSDGAVTGKGKKENFFNETLHLEENRIIWEKVPGAPENDYSFWEKIEISGAAQREYHVSINSPVRQGDGTVRIAFQGRSQVAHHTIVGLNNTQIGEAFWNNDIVYVQEMTIDTSLLNNGDNIITLEFPADTGAPADILYFNWIEVVYPRKFEAKDDKLLFTVKGDERLEIKIENLTQPEIRIYDITDPENVMIVENASVESDGDNYNVTFEDEISGSKSYYLLTPERIRKPANFSLWQPTHLKDVANGADYILITSKDLLDSTEPLCQFRQNQGLRVKAVCMEDISDEFSYGIFTPQAIKDFLQYAYKNWEKPSPEYILLVGDANTDYRDYLGSGKQNKVPTHLSFTSLGLTPDDNWYVCVDGDDLLPDMTIGRITGSTSEIISNTINKIIAYENGSLYVPRNLLLAAYDGGEFANVNENLVPYIPDDFTISKVYGSADSANQIISGINAGQLLTNYVGHGNVSNWGVIFDASHISMLNNVNKFTFVTSMSCLNGYFSHPYNYCISEEFMIARDKGAVAVFSPSGLGQTWEVGILDKEIFSVLFEKQDSIIGSIAKESKIAAYSKGASQDILEMFNLIGDPATHLKYFADGLAGDIDGNGYLEMDDLIFALKILSRVPVTQTLNINADINHNAKIELAEAVYILQQLSLGK